MCCFLLHMLTNWFCRTWCDKLRLVYLLMFFMSKTIRKTPPFIKNEYICILLFMNYILTYLFNTHCQDVKLNLKIKLRTI